MEYLQLKVQIDESNGNQMETYIKLNFCSNISENVSKINV